MGQPLVSRTAAAGGQPSTEPDLPGFIPDINWDLHRGVLEADDALMVVTDGVVEVPGADLDWGVDRLLGHAERLVLSGWAGGADELLAQRRGADDDDAQVLLLSRRRQP